MVRLKVFSAGGKTAGKLCSICQTTIIAGEHLVYCPDCGLPFHSECWQENKGCSQYGCKSAPQTDKEETGTSFGNEVWGDEKPCPACRRKIKAQALKCRHCGATFENRGIITKEQYASREYTGKEYNRARNKVIAVFLLSVFGCLAPIGLIISALLIYQGNCIGIEYKRLPAAMKALIWCAMCLSGFLLFILVLTVMFD